MSNSIVRKVEGRLKEFYENVSEEDIYPLEIDPVASSQGKRMLGLLEAIEKKFSGGQKTSGLNLITAAIKAEPRAIILFRSLIGEHKTTFRLLISTILYKSDSICGCSDIPKIHTEKFLINFVRRSKKARKIIAEYFIERELDLILKIILNLGKKERKRLINLITQYQVKQRLAKLRGHRAEQLIAEFLQEAKVPFEPKQKLRTLGSRDAVVKFLNQRECDLVVPNAEKPRIVIQASYYQSITGSIASKTVRETRETKRAVDRHNKKNPKRHVEFWLFIDGVGWLGMHSILKNIIGIPDDFFQLQTIKTKLIPHLRHLGV